MSDDRIWANNMMSTMDEKTFKKVFPIFEEHRKGKLTYEKAQPRIENAMKGDSKIGLPSYTSWWVLTIPRTIHYSSDEEMAALLKAREEALIKGRKVAK